MGLTKWKVTPLENLEGRTSRDHHSLSNWSRVCRDKKHLGRSRTAPPEFSSRETCCDTSRKLRASRRLGDVKSSKARLQDHQSQRLCDGPCTVNSLRHLNPIPSRTLY